MSISTHPKTWKSYEDQLEVLSDRGLRIKDSAKALEYLERIGYYRLSGYWYPLREQTGPCVRLTDDFKRPKKLKVETLRYDRFLPGASFQNAVDLYVFDKKLRLIALDALERIEVALRVDISHTLGKEDRFAYLRPDMFHGSFSNDLNNDGLTGHHRWLSKHAGLITRSKEEFIAHNRERYGLPIPIWVSCEVWDFGTMSTLFAGLREKDQDAISKKYGIGNGRIFASWLRSLNYLRNVCAHHSRLWNRNIVDQPKLPTEKEAAFVKAFKGDNRLTSRPFLLFCITQHLMKRINPTSTWQFRVRHLLEDGFPRLDHVNLNLASMGVDKHWKRRWPKQKTPERIDASVSPTGAVLRQT